MKFFKNPVKLLVVAMAITLLYSCNDDSDAETLTEQEASDIASESSSHDAAISVEIQAFAEILAEDEGGRIAAGCVAIMRDEQNKKITLDFGTGCVGPYGRQRSGKVIITYGGTFGDHLANRIITFENYFVNNRQISGVLELRDLNLDLDGNLTLTRKHIDLKVTFPNGSHFTSNGTTTVTWVAGYGDENPDNDVFLVTGSQEGISTRGRHVTRVIAEPVRIDFNCVSEGGFAITSGKVEVSVTGVSRERSRIIDYGDGTCDGSITITINGRIFTLTAS